MVVEGEDGSTIGDMESLQKEAVNFFQLHYWDTEDSSIIEQLKIIKKFPHFFSDEEGDGVVAFVTLE